MQNPSTAKETYREKCMKNNKTKKKGISEKKFDNFSPGIDSSYYHYITIFETKK
jgi:hypothetical protein